MPARILVIEDNFANLELMAYLLKVFGHSVLTATNGEEGLAVARRELPDLMVCDVQMPRMDGYEVVRRIKDDSTTRAIPLIAVTALAMVGDRDKVLAAGFDGYIAKPIDPERFVADVESFLGGKLRGKRTEHAAATATPALKAASSHTVVLMVDDSPVNRELVRQTLEPFGYEVRATASVQEALDLMQGFVPDLILSDLHMPNHDGFNLLKTVKGDARLSATPFVFISSSVWGDKDRNLSLELGAARFILRPIEPQALLAEIQAVMKESRKG